MAIYFIIIYQVRYTLVYDPGIDLTRVVNVLMCLLLLFIYLHGNCYLKHILICGQGGKIKGEFVLCETAQVQYTEYMSVILGPNDQSSVDSFCGVFTPDHYLTSRVWPLVSGTLRKGILAIEWENVAGFLCSLTTITKYSTFKFGDQYFNMSLLLLENQSLASV